MRLLMISLLVVFGLIVASVVWPPEMVLLVAVGIFYFLPPFLASIRKHHNTAAIFVMTLFLGWTMIGWVFALIWAFTVPRDAA